MACNLRRAKPASDPLGLAAMLGAPDEVARARDWYCRVERRGAVRARIRGEGGVAELWGDGDRGAVHDLHGGRGQADRAFGAAYDEIRRIEVLMTDWERPGEPESDVVRINKGAGKKPVQRQSGDGGGDREVAGDVATVGGGVRHHVRGDAGAVEVRRGDGATLPSAGEIARRRKLSTGGKMTVDKKAHTVMLRKAGMRLGLGGHRQGLRGRSRAAVLRAPGFARLHRAGGRRSLCRRAARGRNWMVGVRDPRGERGDDLRQMRVEDHAFSTAGDYERVVHPRRQALPPHHRSEDRLPGDGVARGDHLGAGRLPRGRARRRGVHPGARRRG